MQSETEHVGTSARARGMTTGQMEVLWFAVVLLEVILIALCAGAHSEAGATLALACAVVLPAGALIYSLSPHPAARKRRVASVLLIPSCSTLAIGVVAAIIVDAVTPRWPEPHAAQKELVWVDPSKIKVFDVNVQWYHGGRENSISGRLRNGSDARVSVVSMRVRLYDRSGTLIDTGAAAGECDIPPGDTGHFSGQVYYAKPPVTESAHPLPGSDHYNADTGMWERVDYCRCEYYDVAAYTRR